ncbi:MAG: phosphatase PAP2 family protein [Candidatus Cryosericum sp.]
MRKQLSFLTQRARAWLEHPWPFAAFVGAALLYVAALASGIAEDVLDKESIVRVDGWLVQRLAAYRTPFGIDLFKATSFVGEWFIAGTVLAIVVLVLWNRHRRAALALLLSSAGSEVVVFFGKAGFGRPRPPAVLSAVKELDASFPSGHANISVALYALGFYLLFRYTSSPRLKKLWLALAILVPLVIGFGRLYLGAHYLSDVLAGWSVGLWWAIFALGLFGFLRRRHTARLQVEDLRSRPNTAK